MRTQFYTVDGEPPSPHLPSRRVWILYHSYLLSHDRHQDGCYMMTQELFFFEGLTTTPPLYFPPSARSLRSLKSFFTLTTPP